MSRARTVLAAFIILIAAACGGGGDGGTDDGGDPGTAEDVTRTAYVDQANAVCRAEAERRPEQPQPETADEFVQTIRTQIADVRGLQAALKELTPPEADREDVEAWLDLVDREVAALEEGLPAAEEAAKTGDLQATAKAYEPAATRFAELDAENTFPIDYGLDDCADD